MECRKGMHQECHVLAGGFWVARLAPGREKRFTVLTGKHRAGDTPQPGMVHIPMVVMSPTQVFSLMGAPLCLHKTNWKFMSMGILDTFRVSSLGDY